jgi:hypothetical protein
MINLGLVGLLLSLHLPDLALQTLNFNLLLPCIVIQLGLVLFLEGRDTLKGTLFLLIDTLLKLLTLQFVEVLHLSELFLSPGGMLS